MIERRKYARLSINANVVYCVLGHKGRSKEPAECGNISPEGMCLIFSKNHDIKEGTKLEIQIELPGSKAFTMIGEVVWMKILEPKDEKTDGKFKAGIKILEMYNNDENRFLLQLCDRMIQELKKGTLAAES